VYLICTVWFQKDGSLFPASHKEQLLQQQGEQKSGTQQVRQDRTHRTTKLLPSFTTTNRRWYVGGCVFLLPTKIEVEGLVCGCGCTWLLCKRTISHVLPDCPLLLACCQPGYVVLSRCRQHTQTVHHRLGSHSLAQPVSHSFRLAKAALKGRRAYRFASHVV
jgi:hypothetical protein